MGHLTTRQLRNAYEFNDLPVGAVVTIMSLKIFTTDALTHTELDKQPLPNVVKKLSDDSWADEHGRNISTAFLAMAAASKGSIALHLTGYNEWESRDDAYRLCTSRNADRSAICECVEGHQTPIHHGSGHVWADDIISELLDES